MTDKTHILCIDDNDRNLRILEELLSPDYSLDCVTDGASGLEHSRSHPPDLILLDVMMPDIDGLEVCRRVKNDPRTASVPVVLLTAKAQDQDRELGTDAGADAYLMKPFDPDTLLDLVERYVPVRSGHES